MAYKLGNKYLEVLGNTALSLIYDIRCPGGASNRGQYKHKSGMLPFRPTCSVRTQHSLYDQRRVVSTSVLSHQHTQAHTHLHQDAATRYVTAVLGVRTQDCRMEYGLSALSHLRLVKVELCMSLTPDL